MHVRLQAYLRHPSICVDETIVGMNIRMQASFKSYFIQLSCPVQLIITKASQDQR